MLKVILERSSGSSATIEERNIQRMNSDDAVCSTAALIFKKFVAKFSMKTRKWGSTVQILFAPHFSLQGFGHLRESIEIRAWGRDLRSCADPENALFERRSPESGEPYPGAILLGPSIIAVDSPVDRAGQIRSSFNLDRPTPGPMRVPSPPAFPPEAISSWAHRLLKSSARC